MIKLKTLLHAAAATATLAATQTPAAAQTVQYDFSAQLSQFGGPLDGFEFDTELSGSATFNYVPDGMGAMIGLSLTYEGFTYSTANAIGKWDAKLSEDYPDFPITFGGIRVEGDNNGPEYVPGTTDLFLLISDNPAVTSVIFLSSPRYTDDTPGAPWSSWSVGAESRSGNFIWTKTIIPAAGAVPEPTTWALMIGGVGLVGASCRRARTKVRFATLAA